MLKMKLVKTTCSKLIFPALAAAMMFGSSVQTTSVHAQSDGSLSVYNMNASDSNLINELKEAVITNRAETDSTLDLETINIEKSVIDISGLDRTSTALQSVQVKITLYTETDSVSESALGYSFTEDAIVKLFKDSTPTILLKSDTVTVNNGDTWNPTAYIASVHDFEGNLPVIEETDNVDMSNDGTYTATYTAVGVDGSSSTAELTVIVKTHDEVIAARLAAEEEARRIAEEEEEARRQAEEEEERRREEEERERREQLEAAGDGNPVYGDGYNPYWGGWSNCTWSAWELANAYNGVSMPNFGNAGSWCYSASSYGYSTGTTPYAGSIAVYGGHVAYVAAVSEDGSSVYIKEGGFCGGYNERWVSAWGTGTQSLVGYIYFD